MYITQSDRKDKRYVATFDNDVKTHFGLKNGQTYIDHLDKAKRDAYLKRHQKNEDWNDPYTAGALSRWILWGDSTNINKNIADFKKRFNV
jgi:hypothetical protein